MMRSSWECTTNPLSFAKIRADSLRHHQARGRSTCGSACSPCAVCQRRKLAAGVRAQTSCQASSKEAIGDFKEALEELAAAPQDAAMNPQYQAASDYLKSLGFSNRAEIARILDIASNPNSLFLHFRDRKREGNINARRLDVDKDMQPVMEFLSSQGLEQPDVNKVIQEHPAVLCYSPEHRLAPFFEFLRNLGIAHPEQTILQRPSLLGLDPETNLRQVVEYLQANEYTTEEIERLIATTL